MIPCKNAPTAPLFNNPSPIQMEHTARVCHRFEGRNLPKVQIVENLQNHLNQTKLQRCDGHIDRENLLQQVNFPRPSGGEIVNTFPASKKMRVFAFASSHRVVLAVAAARRTEDKRRKTAECCC